VLSDRQLWRLSEAGPDGLALHCGQDGLFLAGTPLIARHGADYRVRPPGEVERLLSCAYGAAFETERVTRGLASVAAALAADNLGLAQIAAAQLRLPALAGPLARTALKAEDLRLACERLDAALTRAGWDPAKHPRAGVPPNPGWFAPTGGAGEIIAQNEEEPRPEEETDPLAAVRRQLWHSDLATLREIDPTNPQLFVLTRRAGRRAGKISTRSMRRSETPRSAGCWTRYDQAVCGSAPRERVRRSVNSPWRSRGRPRPLRL
jgi:hypothetical protein